MNGDGLCFWSKVILNNEYVPYLVTNVSHIHAEEVTGRIYFKMSLYLVSLCNLDRNNWHYDGVLS